MSIEFIIGTIIGLIGIIPVIIMVVKLVKKPNLHELKKIMEKLVDKNTKPEEQRRILRNMNRTLFRLPPLGKKFSKDYINKFSCEGKGKETVFKDMCISNNIIPIREICEALLGWDFPTFREEFYQLFEKTKSNPEKVQ